MSLIHNERTKYLATFANSIGIAAIVAGVITPLVAATYGLSGSSIGWFTVLISLAWFLTGTALHFWVRIILGKRRE